MPKNSIAIVIRVGVGKLALIEKDYATSQDFLSLTIKDYNNVYILYKLYSLINKISKNLQGTSIKGVTKKELLLNKIKVSRNLEEQTKIADFLSNLDKLVEKQSTKINLLKQRKQGLLQKMFV
ncbi:restriction endonuclease subunit S [Staphylococcus debuckii]|uniref:Restriction endonuclease subunit S n=1 Tax=Staphylococcus debuckii TaxID=2044912 RepID=A0ABU9EY73_9STAP